MNIIAVLVRSARRSKQLLKLKENIQNRMIDQSGLVDVLYDHITGVGINDRG